MLELKNEKNYAAQIVRVPKLVKAENSDRLYILHLFGYGVIVDDSWLDREGELAVFFPAECQLSEEFASAANLFRKAEKNADPNETGYLEDNRRVRAIKLRGNVSSALVLPVESVVRFHTSQRKSMPDMGIFEEGTVFDTMDGVEISRKYHVPVKQSGPTKAERKVKKAFKRVDETVFPAHIDTDQWARNKHEVGDQDMLIVTQKLHGTSLRVGRPIVKRQLSWLERLASRLGVQVQETTFDDVAGSRKVIKDVKNPKQDHFYGTDLWSDYLAEVEGKIPDGFIVYGELVGWVDNDKPIQSGHTYECPKGTREFYVYRVAYVTPQGGIWDLSWEQVRKFCTERGMNHVPEVWRGLKEDFRAEDFHEANLFEDWSDTDHGLEYFRDRPARLSDPKLTGADEGIAIRVEKGDSIPALYKVKNPSHYLHETALLDAGEVDTEESQACPSES